MNDDYTTWFLGQSVELTPEVAAPMLPPLPVPTVSREVVEQYQPPDPVRQMIDRMTQEAMDRVTAAENEAIYGTWTMTAEEAAKALGLDKVTVPCSVEPKTILDPRLWEITVGESAEPTAPPPPPPAPEVAGRWDRVGPETKVLDFTDTYMSPVHRPEELLELAVEELLGVEYDTLVGTGLSGTIAVTDLARKLNKRYLIVRKANDGTHSSLPVEGQLGKRWVFVDDLISTGATWARVYDTVLDIKNNRGFDTEYVGALLYTHDRWAPGFYDREQGGHAGWYLLSKYHPDNQKAEPEISW